MISRRNFLSFSGRIGLAGATMPLWSHITSMRAFAQNNLSSYKAVVVITLVGGNDGNNMLIPLDTGGYNQYASLRPSLALPQGRCLPLSFGTTSAFFGLHPALSNIASLYNNKKALFVANVGPLGTPATKTQLLQTPSLVPASLLSHVAGSAQWESATTVALPDTGWGGRMADFLSSSSGSLPPILNAGVASIFTVGRWVQGVVVQADSGTIVALPAWINSALLKIANNDAVSQNSIVSQTAQLRIPAIEGQDILSQAQTA